MGNRIVYKFFVDNGQIKDNEVKIINEDKKHIANVLRMNIKDNILISNKNTSETFKCEICDINKEEITCQIIEKYKISTEPKVEVDLFQGLPKADKFEYIIQKSVELGVHKIIPVNMKYCICKIKDEEKKNERWMKISEAAAKQSKREIIPQIEKSISIEQMCGLIHNYDIVLVAYENEENITIKEMLNKNAKLKKIAIIIGPEGGINDKEIKMLKENGAKIVSLGKRILRTETAPIAVLSIIMYEYD